MATRIIWNRPGGGTAGAAVSENFDSMISAVRDALKHGEKFITATYAEGEETLGSGSPLWRIRFPRFARPSASGCKWTDRWVIRSLERPPTDCFGVGYSNRTEEKVKNQKHKHVRQMVVRQTPKAREASITVRCADNGMLIINGDPLPGRHDRGARRSRLHGSASGRARPRGREVTGCHPA
jgi:hypothetical protein